MLYSNLTFWREHRKKTNLMSFHIFDRLLRSVEYTTGIPKKYLVFMSTDEFEIAVKGMISKNELKRRHDEGMFVTVHEGVPRIFVGKEANSLFDEYAKKYSQGTKEQSTFQGQVASGGYAKGVVRIIQKQEEFKTFKEGEILVTSMTRPEFVPLMKKAAGIVTDEGGITCHAAIVSRELGKPCIIGTKHATTILKNGDLVEVRANHGTIRILK